MMPYNFLIIPKNLNNMQAKKYSWEKCAEETTAVINNLLNN